QFGGAMIESPGEADAFDQFTGPVLDLDSITPGDQRRYQDIFQDRTLRQQVVVLEDKADMAGWGKSARGGARRGTVACSQGGGGRLPGGRTAPAVGGSSVPTT